MVKRARTSSALTKSRLPSKRHNIRELSRRPALLVSIMGLMQEIDGAGGNGRGHSPRVDRWHLPSFFPSQTIVILNVFTLSSATFLPFFKTRHQLQSPASEIKGVCRHYEIPVTSGRQIWLEPVLNSWGRARVLGQTNNEPPQ